MTAQVLQGRHAFVTGSTQGVGLEIAAALHGAGAAVVLHGLRSDAAALLAAERCGGVDCPAPLICCDLADPMP
ncbi:MAG: SDR family NAD(P)-dependent oxidoreductase [Planctomyces sp.]